MRSSSTTRLAAGVLLGLLAAAPVGAQQPARELVIGYVSREGDPAYADTKVRDGVFRIIRKPPLPGAELGLRDATASARAAGLALRLRQRPLGPDEDVGAALAALGADGATAVLLDLPAADQRAAAGKAGGMVLFDVRETDDRLRADTCAAPLLHVQPSRQQRTDAVGQFLAKKNWKKVLVLQGAEDEDKALADAFQASARKFGLRIVAVKPFVISNDPRRREETSVALLTGGSDFDAVFVADSLGDGGRTVGYRLALPRPVVGSHGLSAVAWSPYFERQGAPQLSRRFEREAGRPMGDADWAAWVAVRAVTEAEVREARSRTGQPLLARLLDPELRLELYKGYPGSFRPWDRQLRQAVLLATHDAVVDLAPLDGFLHETNVLDTLGLLPNETPCGRKP
ncbi:type 1 periplasmic-binding domain-containing protein [Alsobacter sp. R-9]